MDPAKLAKLQAAAAANRIGERRLFRRRVNAIAHGFSLRFCFLCLFRLDVIGYVGALLMRVPRRQ